MPANYARFLVGRERTLAANRQLGFMLAFVAGAINAGGFLAVQQYTSHVTGMVSSAADHLVLGRLDVVLTAAGAQASTESFTVSVTGGANNSQALGTASGTITGTQGGTTATYSVTLCGQSTYPSASITLTGRFAWMPNAPVPRAAVALPVGRSRDRRGATSSGASGLPTS